MAVTPIAPATFAHAAIAPAHVAAEPAVNVTPAAAATNSGASDSATSDQSDSQKLPLDKALDEINDQRKPGPRSSNSR